MNGVEVEGGYAMHQVSLAIKLYCWRPFNQETPVKPSLCVPPSDVERELIGDSNESVMIVTRKP